MSQSSTLVLNTSFKTRDQYAILEHINGPIAIQLASFIMLGIPMYNHYEELNWNTCIDVNKEFMSTDETMTQCKQDHEYGKVYTDFGKKSPAMKDCYDIYNKNDNCTMYFMAVRVMVLNIICIIGFSISNKFSNYQREQKKELDDAKRTSRKANIYKPSTQDILQAWSVILPTLLYLYQMFTFIVTFSDFGNFYSFIDFLEQEVTKDEKGNESTITPAYKLRPFASVLLFICIDFISQFVSLFILGFVNLFSSCKPSETERLSDPDWRFNVKLYTTVLNVVLNNIVITRIIQIDPQQTNFWFIDVMFDVDLVFFAIFVFGSSFMLWIKLFFGKLLKFEAEQGFSLQVISSMLLPFLKMRFAAVFIGCIYIVVYYRRNGVDLVHPSRQVAYDWIEFQTLMITGLFLYASSLGDLTNKMPKKAPNVSYRYKGKTEEEEEEEEEEAVEESHIQQMLSNCLTVSFHDYLKVILIHKEKEYYDVAIEADDKEDEPGKKMERQKYNDMKRKQGKLAEHIEEFAQLGRIAEKDQIEKFEEYVLGHIKTEKQETRKKKEQRTSYISNILNWKSKAIESDLDVKQKLINSKVKAALDITDGVKKNKACQEDLLKRFDVFDDNYSETLFESVLKSVTPLGSNAANSIEELFNALRELNDLGHKAKEAEEGKDMESGMEKPAAAKGRFGINMTKGFNTANLNKMVKAKGPTKADYIKNVEDKLRTVARSIVFDHRKQMLEKLNIDNVEDIDDDAKKTNWLRVEPFLFNKDKTDKATIIYDEKKAKEKGKDKKGLYEMTEMESSETLLFEYIDSGCFTVSYDFDGSIAGAKEKLQDAWNSYCELLEQFAEDADKAQDVDFDCSGEGGDMHIIGPVLTEESKDFACKDADGKPFDISKFEKCSECNLWIVYPRKERNRVRRTVHSFQCRGFQKNGKCGMIYCLACSKEKILATSAYVEHGDQVKYLALAPDIYSASFVSFITDSSQIPSQPLCDPMQQSAFFQKTQMTFALQSGICFLILSSSFDNQFQKPDPLFLMMQMLTAYLFHALALGDVKGSYIKLKFLYRNPSKFEESSQFSAFMVCFQQFFISLVCETMNLIFLCKQTNYVDLVMNYVAFAGILAIDDEILASIAGNFPGVMAILEDPSILKALKITKDTVLTSQQEEQFQSKKKGYISGTFHIVRIIFKLFYYYMYPLLVIPLQIYLYNKFAAEPDLTVNSYFDKIVPVDRAAVEKEVFSQIYQQDNYHTYLLRVLACVWAILPLAATLLPFVCCIECYKDYQREQERKKALQPELQPLINDSMMMDEPADGMMAEGGNPDVSVLEDADDKKDEPAPEKPLFIIPCLKKIAELIAGLVCLALYVFYVIKTADFFAYCLQSDYGQVFVMTCIFITMQMFFFEPEKVFVTAIPQLVFIPLMVWAYMYERENAANFITSKWTWSVVFSIMQAPMFFGADVHGAAKCGGFLCCLFGGPYIWYYVLFPAAYYVGYIPVYYVIWVPIKYIGFYCIIVPIYFVGYCLLYLAPYYVLYIPGKFLAFYVVELYNYLASIGILVSFVKTVYNTVCEVVKAPFNEFVYKPLAFVFGAEEAKYSLVLIVVPFVLVMISAIVNKISKACRKSDKAKTA